MMKLMCIRCPKLLVPIVRLFAKTKREMDAFERHVPPQDKKESARSG